MAKIAVIRDVRKKENPKEQEAQIKLSITHRSSTSYIPLGIFVREEEWNAKDERVKKNHKRDFYNDQIKTRKLEAETRLLQLMKEMDLSKKTAREVKDLLLEYKSKEEKSENRLICKTFEQFLTHKSGRTKGLYEVTKNRLKDFTKDNFEKITFDEINPEWLQCFDDFMSKTAPSANSRSIHMRNLRAVFNYAIDNEITDNYPFRRFKIKSEVTRNRDLSVETLREIMKMENLEEWEVKYRDFFMLTFMLIGINVIDLCNLKEIRNGRIEYIRAKTHKLYSIKVEPEALTIMEKYKGENNLLCYLDSNTNYRFFYNNLVKGLNSIRDKLKLKELTTYWARHTWATIASDLDIPDQVISLALGHGPLNPTTEIYIHRNKKKIDEANRQVLDWVFYGKK